MNTSFDSTERTPGDFILFGAGFAGFLLAAGGVIVASPAAAIAGACVLVLAVACFKLRP